MPYLKRFASFDLSQENARMKARAGVCQCVCVWERARLTGIYYEAGAKVQADKNSLKKVYFLSVFVYCVRFFPVCVCVCGNGTLWYIFSHCAPLIVDSKHRYLASFSLMIFASRAHLKNVNIHIAEERQEKRREWEPKWNQKKNAAE